MTAPNPTIFRKALSFYGLSNTSNDEAGKVLFSWLTARDKHDDTSYQAGNFFDDIIAEFTADVGVGNVAYRSSFIKLAEGRDAIARRASTA